MAMYLFPASWLTPERKQDVMDLLRRLPLDPADKKQVFLEWAERAGVQLNAEEIREVTGRPAYEV